MLALHRVLQAHGAPPIISAYGQHLRACSLADRTAANPNYHQHELRQMVILLAVLAATSNQISGVPSFAKGMLELGLCSSQADMQGSGSSRYHGRIAQNLPAAARSTRPEHVPAALPQARRRLAGASPGPPPSWVSIAAGVASQPSPPDQQHRLLKPAAALDSG